MDSLFGPIHVRTREFDHDKEEKYATLTTETDALEKELKDALEELDHEKASIERKLKTKTATRRDLERLDRLRAERDTLAKKLDKTKTALATYTKVMIEKTKEDKERMKVLREVFRMIRLSEKIDLCFMVDCTGSMSAHIAAVKDQIRAIVNKIKKTCSNANIKLSFLGYRDICDGSNEFSILEFTSSVADFENFVASVGAFGGGDGPEDIGGALVKANELNWSQGTRIIIHIADAPAHGSQYNSMPDDYPGGVGISLPDQLLNLHKEHQVMYYFAHIYRKFTEKMVQTLNKEMGMDYIAEIELGNPEELTSLVTTTVRKSVTKSFTMSSKATESKHDEYLSDARFKGDCDKTKPDWSKLPTYSAEIIAIPDYEDVAALKESNLKLVHSRKSVKVQIDSKPMAKGAIRAAIYGRCDGGEVIFKKFLKTEANPEKDMDRYLQTMEESAIAAFLADEYTKNGEQPGIRCVQFLRSLIVKVKDASGKDELYFMEKALPINEKSKFVKYVDNAAHWDEDALDPCYTLPMFAKWTHDFTDGYIMVADLQGVDTGKEYLLTDPVILCKDMSRFGVTNLGPEMINKYLNSLEAFD